MYGKRAKLAISPRNRAPWFDISAENQPSLPGFENPFKTSLDNYKCWGSFANHYSVSLICTVVLFRLLSLSFSPEKNILSCHHQAQAVLEWGKNDWINQWEDLSQSFEHSIVKLELTCFAWCTRKLPRIKKVFLFLSLIKFFELN